MIIDDTYNASPAAVKAALDSLYAIDTPQRIAILGMMNELGNLSPETHKKIGEYCDPKHLNLVVTIGKDANDFLAPAAEKRGCRVYKASDAKDAGEFVKKEMVQGATILAKGSQNGVFAEEAVKILLDDPSDRSKLVRQSEVWLKKKMLRD
jgi:UDP-N-acetylmuramyl pentapeptide synthase